MKTKEQLAEEYVIDLHGKSLTQYDKHDRRLSHRGFVFGYSAAQLESEKREAVLLEAIEDSKETLKTVIDVVCDWSLEQERIGNKAICLSALNKISEALAKYNELKTKGE